MAESSLAIDTEVIDGAAPSSEGVNSSTDVNTIIDEIVTKFNAALETVTGHHHDGTNSRSVTIGIDGLSMEEYAWINLMGGDL